MIEEKETDPQNHTDGDAEKVPNMAEGSQTWQAWDGDGPPITVGYLGVLVCPACGAGNLHQSKAVEVKGPNQWSKGDGTLIGFGCEHCENPWSMYIGQHKGSTYMQWVPTSTMP